MNNKELIYNELNKRGYNNAVIYGIMANIYYESGYNPEAVGDNGTSYGLCQWHNNRRLNLLNKKNYNKIDVQINYLFEELSKSYATVRNVINEAKNNVDDAYNVAYIFCKKFEIPADTENQAIKRGNYAKELFKEYKNVKLKTNNEIVDEVITGLWGNGEERKQKLTRYGYNYETIQQLVNDKLKKNNKIGDTFQKIFFTRKTNEEIAKEVIQGKWKNGEERKALLKDAGYDYSEVQKIVNKILKG